MYKHMKKIISILLAAFIAFSCIGTFASAETSKKPIYEDAVKQLINLGIFSGNETGDFNPDGILTREQLAKLIIKMLKLEDQVTLMESTSKFPDVEVSRWSNGYINVAVEMGYMNGKLDGNFYPEESINLGAFCTAMVRALGYSNAELAGVWPYNYIFKANDLELLEDISLKSTDSVPRWAAALVAYRLLDKPMKNNPAATFAETYDYYSTYIVLETNVTSSDLAQNEIITDKGKFTVGKASESFEPGKKYRLSVDDEAIETVFGEEGTVKNISVESISGTTITYSEKGKTMTMSLPTITKYYYKGALTAYSNAASLIQANTSMVLFNNESGTGYEYIIIYDPIYSSPQIATGNKLGNIDYEVGMLVTKNGKMINVSDINKNDVVYQVSDIWGINKYILVVDNTVEGEISAILPNKITPKEVMIDNVKYELSQYMNLNKLNGKGFLKVEDDVTALLGRDGKIVDIVMNSSENNSNYALVLNDYVVTSTALEDFGEETYFVKLLHFDGTVKTYKFYNEELGFNGKLVNYTIVADKSDDEDYETVKLEEIENITSKEYNINKEKRKIDSYYFADNIVIFNLVRTTFGADSNAYILDWESLPNGIIPSGKIKYIHKTGAFEDVNVLFVENILDEDRALGMVTKMNQSWSPATGLLHSNTILVDGKEYVTNYHIDGMYKGSIVQVRINGGSITSLDSLKTPWVESTSVNAIDTNRIKIKDTIYEFNENVEIYFKDYDGNYERKGIKDIKVGESYGRISVYLDKSTKYDGKVSMIIVSPY